MRAKRLKEHGGIGICSPSHIAKYDDYQNVLNGIKYFGFNPIESDDLYKNTYGYLASEIERANDFNQLILNKDVDLILFGGGEGGNELLPYINYENIKKYPKLICSYSDGTYLLNSIWTKTGLEVYYGQMPGLFRYYSEYDLNQFKAHLMNECHEHFSNSEWHVCHEGECEGIMIGGYLRNFALMLNNKYMPLDLDKKYILFLEDHEKFGGVDYVSAMLSHIEQNDFIHSVSGLIFGHYSEQLNHDLLNRLRRFGNKYNIPVIYCDDFGHGKNHAILPIGRNATLDTKTNKLTYL